MKPVYIDIGSHDGRELQWALANGYEVHSFEPNPLMKEFLEPYESLATINYVACSNQDGFTKLFKRAPGDNSDQGVSIVPGKTNVDHDNWWTVPTIDTGKYLYELNKDIDILKIDTEGAEFIIIESILDHFDHTRIKEWHVEDHWNRIDDNEWQRHRKAVLKRLEELNIELIPWL